MNKSQCESSKKQRQLIALACTQLGLNRAEKAGMLTDRYGKGSTTELTFAEAEEVIDDFVAKGFSITSPKRRYMKRKAPAARRGKDGKLVALVSPAELEKIDALAGLISWKVADGQERWMKRRFKIRQVRTSLEALKVIEGLKGMFINQMKQRFGEDWWIMDHGDVNICRFIIEHFPAGRYGHGAPAFTWKRLYPLEEFPGYGA